MDDRLLLTAFEDCSFPADLFHHRQHIRVAWLILRDERSLLPAIERFSNGLKRFAESKGASGLYHETITWAYLLLIHERMHQGPPHETFDDFAADHPDLLTWKPSVLEAYYRPETLGSQRAREVFVMPDRGATAP
jgi:hypothetical protein